MSSKNWKSAPAVPRRRARAQSPESKRDPGFFPFARYVSVAGVHLTIIAFITTSQIPFLNRQDPSPLNALVLMCGGAVLLQGWWGGWVRNWLIEFSLGGTADEMNLAKQKMNSGKWAISMNAWLATLLATIPIFVVIVLFGAPIASYGLHTYLLSCLISLLTVFAPAYALGLPSIASDTSALVGRLTWIRLFAELSPRNPIERAIVYPVIGTLVGCWAGAFLLALDWDQPWQAWPLTPALGGVSGYVAGTFGALSITAMESLAKDLARRRIKAKSN